jgi:hypothetical protein
MDQTNPDKAAPIANGQHTPASSRSGNHTTLLKNHPKIILIVKRTHQNGWLDSIVSRLRTVNNRTNMAQIKRSIGKSRQKSKGTMAIKNTDNPETLSTDRCEFVENIYGTIGGILQYQCRQDIPISVPAR